MDVSSASTKAEKRKETILVVTALTFALSFILIGIPLWWKTTDVYRVSLPYSEIEQLPLLQIGHVIPVTIILADRNLLEGKLWEELTLSSIDENDSLGASELAIQYAWKMRVNTNEEEEALQKCSNLRELDELLNRLKTHDEIGEYFIIIYNERQNFPSPSLIGCYRRGYIAGSNDVKTLRRNIISVVRTMIQADILQKIYSPPSLYERKKPEKERMRSLTAATAFDITFSLVIPEPQVLKPQWEIEEAIQAYIMPFINKISLIADVDIRSQILYMAKFPVQTSMRGEKGEHYINEELLPSIINPVEDKLGSYASVNPNLNFVVYIPPRDQSPLFILDQTGELVLTNAFLSPRWGGFLIENIESANKTEPYELDLDMAGIMGVFLAQLKLLLGLPEIATAKDQNIDILHSPKCCEWELDFLMRKTAQEQLSIAVSSLYSLGQLLQKISNIVIRDDVGAKIYFALSSIKDSMYALEQGFLEDASASAQRAYNASEEAFFDPSLLALLYFPEDQKYAIYIPLFLPVSIPVIMSLKQIWTYWKNRRTKQKKD